MMWLFFNFISYQDRALYCVTTNPPEVLMDVECYYLDVVDIA